MVHAGDSLEQCEQGPSSEVSRQPRSDGEQQCTTTVDRDVAVAIPGDQRIEVAAGGARDPKAAPEVAVRVEGLGYRIGGAQIIADIDVQVQRGELIGIIGPNGAGKTTFFNLLSGLLRPTSGTIWLAGRDVVKLSPVHRAKLGLSRTFQTSQLFGAMSVLDNVRLAAQARSRGVLQWCRRPRAEDEAGLAAHEALASVGMLPLAHHLAGALSHGDKRKVELAILVASEADVVLLDEPMAGVHSDDVEVLTALIDRLHAEGRTVLMVEHRMEVVMDLADRVAVLHQGRLLVCDTPSVVMADESVQGAYLGEPL
jgi:branched-chain amino acid transport system ATP-binding protein